MELGKIIEIISSLKNILRIPIWVVIVSLSIVLINLDGVRELLFGLEWKYQCNQTTETAVLGTDTELKKGSAIIRVQLEAQYEGKTFYIIEMKEFYDNSETELKNGNGDEGAGAHFSFVLMKSQRKKLDVLKKKLEKMLKESLERKYKGVFDCDKLEMVEKQLVKISYQKLHRNMGRSMYLSVSEEAVRTIPKKENDQGKLTSIKLDGLDLSQSFYANLEITNIVTSALEDLKKFTKKGR